MTPEERRIRGNDARALLDNRMLRDAFSAVNDYLDAQELACDPSDKDKAQRLIISKQLLRAVRREIERQIQDGDVAAVQIQEIEQRKGLRRFIR